MKQLLIFLAIFLGAGLFGLTACQKEKMVAGDVKNQGSGADNNPAPQQTAHFKKVVYIVFENEDFNPVIHQADFARFAAAGVNFTSMISEIHPSQRNYIAMVAGSPLKVMSDKNYDLKDSHLGDLLEAKGMDWKVYAEDYPGDCFTGVKYKRFLRSHVPFLSFLNVTLNPARCAKIVDNKSFFDDFNSDRLPEFSMYIPNVFNDGHDTKIDYAGKWLMKNFGPILLQPEAMKDVIFLLTFDESNAEQGSNTMYTVLLGANVKAMESNQKVNHFSFLKMIEDEFKLGNLGRMDSKSAPIENIWKN